MPPFDRILVPVGPGPVGERALVVALELVRRTGVPLGLLRVVTPGDEIEPPARLSALADLPTDVVSRVRGYGSIAKAIIAAVEPGTLVCMSSHGGYGPARTLIGGVTEEVLRSVAEPVLVIGPRVRRDVPLDEGRIVACLDETPYSERTLEPAQHWSRAFGFPLWLVQLVPSPGPGVDQAMPDDLSPERRLDALSRRIGGTQGCCVLRDRHPGRALAALATDVPIAALVMATHGRTGWTRVLAGSVTAATVHRATVPVLVVPAVLR